MIRPVLIVNARLLDPASGLDAKGGLLAVGGRIAEVGPAVTAAMAPGGAEVIDAKGLCLAPGLVDMRVQLGEPGAEHKERIDSGALAAAAGGVTSMAVLPNTDPPIDDPAMVEFVARRARQVKLGKVYPYAAITKRIEGEELAEIGLLKAAGAVAFTDGERALANARVMRRALAYAACFDALIVQHPEEPTLAEHGVMNEGPLASRLGLAGISPAAEAIMVERDLRLLELSDSARLHFAHVSTREAIQAIRAAKARGLRVTCDTAPHYLALNELEVEGYRTFAKVSPPLRSEDDRRAVVEGLKDGTIDAIASDHCPQDQDSKRLPFAQAAFGVIGVQTMLPVCLRLFHEGELGLLPLLRTMTEAPARILGLEAGRLQKGAPADLVLFDPEAPWKITEASLKSLSKNTAFEGRLVEGRVVRTLVDGRTVFHDEAVA
ncbi:dihydroorotase [Benzoatithermus flavus]|uniref:Dihydroorotase n=1 Tax=Benzoatithermus flavus TaxID=3108223 RepID=A0ABU8XNA3_9PROT